MPEGFDELTVETNLMYPHETALVAVPVGFDELNAEKNLVYPHETALVKATENSVLS